MKNTLFLQYRFIFTGPPPSKRSRTQLTTESDRLPQVSPASSSEMAHRTLSGTEGVEDTTEDVPQLTEDDKKALPRDIEIPLRFQVSNLKSVGTCYPLTE